jgi:hypothetical protein
MREAQTAACRSERHYRRAPSQQHALLRSWSPARRCSERGSPASLWLRGAMTGGFGRDAARTLESARPRSLARGTLPREDLALRKDLKALLLQDDRDPGDQSRLTDGSGREAGTRSSPRKTSRRPSRVQRTSRPVSPTPGSTSTRPANRNRRSLAAVTAFPASLQPLRLLPSPRTGRRQARSRSPQAAAMSLDATLGAQST